MKRCSVMKAVFKVIYDPENYDEAKAVRDMNRATDYKLVLWDLDNHLREQLKYNTQLSDGEQKAYDETRQYLHSLLREYNVELE